MKYMFYKANEYNQCLSTWADKTPNDVNTVDMFQFSSCPNQDDPASNLGPWCQDYNICQVTVTNNEPSDVPSGRTSDVPNASPVTTNEPSDVPSGRTSDVPNDCDSICSATGRPAITVTGIDFYKLIESCISDTGTGCPI